MNDKNKKGLMVAVAVILIAMTTTVILYPHEIEVSWEGEGDVTPDGGSIRFYESLDLRIEPAEGWTIDIITIGGEEVSLEGTMYSLKVSAFDFSTLRIHVVFVKDSPPETHIVTVSSTDGGTISPSGAVEVLDGGSVSFVIKPNEGYRLDSLEVDGERVASGVSSYILSDIRKDMTVRAVFEYSSGPGPTPQPERYTVTASASEGGSISPSGPTTVTEGGTITFTMSPDAGYTLSSLLVDGEPVTVDGNTYTLQDIRSDHRVHATFEENEPPEPETHSVTITSTANGTVTPFGTVHVTDGEDLTLTITPDEGYRLGSLTVDGMTVTTSDLTYTLSDVTGDRTIHAEFVEILDRIEITSEPMTKVYTAGDTFDPTGMVVTAFYTDGTSRVLDPSEYTYEPSGALAPEHTSVVVTHQGKTDSVDISVANPDDFDVIVTHYEGTRMENGKKVSFSEEPNIPLDEFSFDTLNITPNTKQTVTMVVSNGTGMRLAASVFVADPDISEGMGLAEQLTLSITSDSGTYKASVADVISGTILPLETLSPGSSVTVSVTLEFPESDHNNEAMGQRVSFGLGILAGQEATST